MSDSRLFRDVPDSTSSQSPSELLEIYQAHAQKRNIHVSVIHSEEHLRVVWESWWQNAFFPVMEDFPEFSPPWKLGMDSGLPLSWKQRLLHLPLPENTDWIQVNRETPLSQVASLPAGFVYPSCLLSDRGTIVISRPEAEWLSLLPRVCVFLASPSSLISSLGEWLRHLQSELSSSPSLQEKPGWTLCTGPSQTADIEKTLVRGAHGPAHVSVWILLER